jgi:hypothetical protein
MDEMVFVSAFRADEAETLHVVPHDDGSFLHRQQFPYRLLWGYGHDVQEG